jgi:hypothetical protein
MLLSNMRVAPPVLAIGLDSTGTQEASVVIKTGFRLAAAAVAMLLMGVVSFAQAQPQPTALPAQTLQDRANAYYQALAKQDNATAFTFVAPESKNNFFKLHNDGLVDIKVLGVTMGDGATATIRVQKTVKPLQFKQTIDIQAAETWKQIDDQWYVVLPDAKDIDSPFGRMFNANANPNATAPNAAQNQNSSAPPDLATIQKRAEMNNKNADPDQYLLALKNAMAQTAAKNAQNAQATKDGKTTTPDKKKTDQDKPKQNSDSNQNN